MFVEAVFISGSFVTAAFVPSADFICGTRALKEFLRKPTSGYSEVHAALEKAGISGKMTWNFLRTQLLVRVRQFKDDANGLPARMKEVYGSAMPGHGK